MRVCMYTHNRHRLIGLEGVYDIYIGIFAKITYNMSFSDSLFACVLVLVKEIMWRISIFNSLANKP